MIPISNPAPSLWIVSDKNDDDALCPLWVSDLLHNWSFLTGCGIGLLVTIGYLNLTTTNLAAEPVRLPPVLKCLVTYRL